MERNILSQISMDRFPLTLIIPIAPPGVVAIAAIVFEFVIMVN